MRLRLGVGATVCVALAMACSLPLPAQAQDFFSTLFGGFGARPHRAPVVAPSDSDGNPTEYPRSVPRSRGALGGGGQAWCVRTCDGRYFLISGADAQSKTASCNSFCPAGKAEVVYGNDIDHAATASGKSYSQLPNAFRYRSEVVTGCTCNGKDSAGLASVPVENDPTLRKGDIVAGANGLVIANTEGGKHAEVNFTPLPDKLRARLKQVPVVAKE